jgi:hypothetical protein
MSMGTPHEISPWMLPTPQLQQRLQREHIMGMQSGSSSDFGNVDGGFSPRTLGWKREIAECIATAGTANVDDSMQDRSDVDSDASCHERCRPCISPRDAMADEISSLIVREIHLRLPEHHVKSPEKSIDAKGFMRVKIWGTPPDGAAIEKGLCYDVLQDIEHECRALFGSQSSSLIYTSARVGLQGYCEEGEDVDTSASLKTRKEKGKVYGYRLRPSVACIPEDKKGQLCRNVLRKSRCPNQRWCRFYHPQPCDFVKFSVVIRSIPRCNEALQSDQTRSRAQSQTFVQ